MTGFTKVLQTGTFHYKQSFFCSNFDFYLKMKLRVLVTLQDKVYNQPGVTRSNLRKISSIVYITTALEVSVAMMKKDNSEVEILGYSSWRRSLRKEREHARGTTVCLLPGPGTFGTIWKSRRECVDKELWSSALKRLPLKLDPR